MYRWEVPKVLARRLAQIRDRTYPGWQCKDCPFRSRCWAWR